MSPFPLSPAEAAAVPHGVRHPIHELVANATKVWQNKLARQSKTLESAVKEYTRRYKRIPPKGFDKWLVVFVVFLIYFPTLKTITLNLNLPFVNNNFFSDSGSNLLKLMMLFLSTNLMVS